jgi:hypothetical protein
MNPRDAAGFAASSVAPAGFNQAADRRSINSIRLEHNYISRYPVSLKGLECSVSKLANSDACPRPTTQELEGAGGGRGP